MSDIEESNLNNCIIEEELDSSNKAKNNKPSVKKNYIYNVIYQLFLIIVPLVVTPYISRVLLPDGIGKYSFSFSLITYFTIFGALGFGYYAQREIAKHQNDKKSQTICFWEINICRLIPVSITLLTNISLCVFNVYDDYNSLMWIFSTNIIALAFDISFYFQGNENFRRLVIRNVLIKVISTVAIFLLVKTPDDLWIYALINASMVLVSNLSMWVGLHKYIVKCNLRDLKPLRHMKGTIRLFIPTIATTIYTVLDRTLVGLLVPGTYTVIENGIEVVKKYSDLENGYYEQSEKIVKMAMTFITSIGTVMIPRNTNEIAKGNIGKVKANVITSSRLVWLIGIPMMLGLIVVSRNFVPWFFGEGYDKCSTLMMIFSPLVLFIGFSNVFGLQYMIPMGYDKKFTASLITGSLINIILNCIFIPIWWSIGAAIASIIAELFVTLMMIFILRKEIDFKAIIKSSIKYLIAGTIMFSVALTISYLVPSSIWFTLLLISVGMAVYVLSLILLKEKYTKIFIHKIFGKSL